MNILNWLRAKNKKKVGTQTFPRPIRDINYFNSSRDTGIPMYFNTPIDYSDVSSNSYDSNYESPTNHSFEGFGGGDFGGGGSSGSYDSSSDNSSYDSGSSDSGSSSD